MHRFACGWGLLLPEAFTERVLFLREVGAAVNVDVIVRVEGGGRRAPSASMVCTGRSARPGGVPAGVHVAGSGASTARFGD